MMKDEAVGRITEEFVRLRVTKCRRVKKCKGVKKSIMKKINHDHFKECLFNRKPQMRKMNVIRTHLHETVNKIALSADKRVNTECWNFNLCTWSK